MTILHTDCNLFDILTQSEIAVVRRRLDTPNVRVIDITLEEFYTLMFLFGSDTTMLIKMHAISMMKEKFNK